MVSSAILAEVSTGVGQTDYKRSLAYQRLGISPKDVQPVPFFRNQLKRIARLMARDRDDLESSGARTGPLDYLRSSEDPEARKVLDVYSSVPQSYRRLLPPEAFCQVAGVSPRRVMEAITLVAVRETAQASALIAAVMSPRVVAKTVERALQENGAKERLILHKATGFVPTWGWKDSRHR
jgi:hypothetical protein